MNATFAREWRWLIGSMAISALILHGWFAVMVARSGGPWWGAFSLDSEAARMTMIAALFGGPLVYAATGFVRLTIAAFRSK